MKYRYLCLGCLKSTGHEDNLYCSACRKSLLFGPSVSHRLTFNKEALAGTDDRVRVKRGSVLPDPNGEHRLLPIPAQTGIRYLEDIPANFHTMAQIASQVFGVSAVPSAMIFFANGEPACIVSQHQEKEERTDFLSLAEKTEGFDPLKLSYLGIARLIRRYLPAYVVELERFYKLLLFQYVISNGDMGAEKIHLLKRASGDYGLAPSLLLNASILHDQAIPPLGLPLFDRDIDTQPGTPEGHYTRADFLKFAELIGIGKDTASVHIDAFTEAKDTVFYLVERSLLSSAAKKIFKKHYLDRLYEISDTFGRPRV